MSMSTLTQALKAATKSGLIAAGTAAGGYYGGNTGAQVGGYLGAGLSKLIGSGDYVANSLVKAGRGIPMAVESSSTSLGNGKFRLRHREFISEIINLSPGVFSLQSFGVNPGDYTTFPWLSHIAHTFERYKFNGLAFEFVSQTSLLGSVGSTSLGKVMISAEYNVTAPNFVNARAMENSNECLTFKPSEHAVYGIECLDTPQDRYFVRNTPDSANPLVTMDMCNLLVATTSSITGVLGDLWAVYDIEFDRPYIQDDIPNVFNGSFLHANCQTLPLDFGTGIVPLFSTISTSNLVLNSVVNFTTGFLNIEIVGLQLWDVFTFAAYVEADTAQVLQPYGLASAGTGYNAVLFFDGGLNSGFIGSDVASTNLTKKAMTERCFQVTSVTPSIVIRLNEANSGSTGNCSMDLVVRVIRNPGGPQTSL